MATHFEVFHLGFLRPALLCPQAPLKKHPLAVNIVLN
jgi:hypothetical protein